MQITIDIEQDLYEDIKEMGIDIHSKVKEYVKHLTDVYDYPAISTEEAKKRVADAVESYKNGTLKTVPFNDGMDELDKWLDTL